MCGILAIWYQNGRPVDLVAMQRGTNTLRHRGPDDEGYLLADTATGRAISCGGADTDSRVTVPRILDFAGQCFDLALGHRRLAILDLSPAGHQPLCSPAEAYWIVYNGEVYNYLELRRQLVDVGYRFHSDTDTEVLLAAYREWGTECLAHFNGMWAFALWDAHRRQLFCARDRFGIKPLYYLWNGHRFACASEIKALLALPGVSREVCEPAVYDYLSEGLLDHLEETFFEGIRQLLPGHCLTLDAAGRLRIWRWYDFEVDALSALPDPAQDAELVREFMALLEDAVRLRLRSDVPLGTCLSGGLDSSTIVGLVNRIILDEAGEEYRAQVGERQKTFTSCFEDRRFDERHFVEAVAERTGVDHNYVFPSRERLWDELPRVVWHHDEPFGSTGMYAQWNVMRLARERGVTVLLDGQGGDELLCGYPHHLPVWIAQLLRGGRPGLAFREARAVAASGLLNGALLLNRAIGGLLPTGLWLGLVQTRRRLAAGNSQASMRVLTPQFRRRWKQRTWGYLQSLTRDSLNRRLREDVTTYSLPALLRYEDRDSMAFSVEARVPFLDCRVVEYVFSLPAEQKVRRGWTKWVLRQATAGLLPDVVRWRRDKMGFVAPEVPWLRASKERVRQLFSEQPLSAPYLDPSQVSVLLESALERRADVGWSEVWRWINLEVWLRTIIAG